MSRRIHAGLKGILLIAGLLVMVAAAWPRGRLAMLWAAGRCEACSFRNAMNSHNLLMNLRQAGERIGAASRVVATDPQHGFEQVETPMGRFWTTRNDRFLKFTLAEEQLEIYEGDDIAVHPGDVVLDCGANAGVFTRTALDRGAKLVVSIEPAPGTAECLRRNYEREIEEGRVIVVQKGVWDHPDVLELAEGDDGNTTGDSFVFGRDQKNKIKVPLITIDALTDELKLPRVDFIKMDIEGAEKQALRGAAGTIRKYRPRMAISSEHLPDDVTAIPNVVNAIWPGYQMRPSDCQDEFLKIKPAALLFQAK